MTIAQGIGWPSVRGHLQRSVPPAWVLHGATLDTDFINRRAYRENRPALQERFVQATLGDLLTNTRASSGGRFQADGDYVQMAADALRFDHNPVTLAPLGILIEGARTNVISYSAEIDNSAWTKTNCTVSANAGTAPTGNTTADKIVESSGDINKTVSNTFTATSGVTYTATVYLKASGRRWVRLALSSGLFGASNLTWFDLELGVVGTNQGATTASITAVGNGWYRCRYTRTATSTGTAGIFVAPNSADNQTSYTGDGASGTLFWGAQVEEGAFPSSYIATTSAPATRASDMLTATVGGWFNPSEGTLIAEWSLPFVGDAGTRRAVQIDAGDNSSYIGITGRIADGTVRYPIVDGGVTQTNLSFGSAISGQIERVPVAYKLNDLAGSRNGGATEVDAIASIPSGLTTVRFGRSATTSELFGHLRRVSYIPRRVSNAGLQALSA